MIPLVDATVIWLEPGVRFPETEKAFNRPKTKVPLPVPTAF